VPVELAGIQLTHVTGVTVTETARFARHAVPGMHGDLAQALGRASAEVELRGIFYGPSAPDELDQLRAAYDGGEPVTLFLQAADQSELTQALHFTDVLIAALVVEQRAGAPDEFGFSCRVVEYVPPPAPVPVAAPGLELPGAEALNAVDLDVLDEAMAAVDGVQDALAAVAELGDLLANIPSFADPTTRLPQMLDLFTPLASGGAGTLGDVRDAIDPPA
jgi:DNA circularisation protein N-terminus